MKFFGWLGSLFGRSRLDKGQMSNPFIGTTSASGNAINAETALELSAVRAIAKPSHRLLIRQTLSLTVIQEDKSKTRIISYIIL